MHLVIDGSLGDEVALTGLVRELKRARPPQVIRVTCRHPELFQCNPYIGSGDMDDHRTINIPLSPDCPVGNFVVAYGAHLGITVHNSDPELFLTPDEVASVSVPSDAIAMDTWAGWPRRRWPLARFQELADVLRRGGANVLEVGRSTSDCHGHVRTAVLANTTASYLDRLTVRQTAAVLAKCALFVGNDSGLAHLAAAVGTPQVVIYSIPWHRTSYSSTWPVFTPETTCTSCGTDCAKSPPCLDGIEVEHVLAVGRAALAAREARPYASARSAAVPASLL